MRFFKIFHYPDMEITHVAPPVADIHNRRLTGVMADHGEKEFFSFEFLNFYKRNTVLFGYYSS